MVFPDPDAPTIATADPASIAKFTSSSIVNGESPLVTTLVRLAARRIELDMGGGGRRREAAGIRAIDSAPIGDQDEPRRTTAASHEDRPWSACNRPATGALVPRPFYRATRRPRPGRLQSTVFRHHPAA